ncbi:hypothetical protein R9C00_14400 [Flammeovirgaceae bacterium SG7u.111]|nr:hypothetical protein [Flammeovirgaceae bacterium SG7u.132]WPO38648.1 hypothetical protein R9C00_14400 [Flammeovirgaceae bacterium SG7u.111]
MKQDILLFHSPLVLKTVYFNQIDELGEYIDWAESKITAKFYLEKKVKPVLMKFQKEEVSSAQKVNCSGVMLELMDTIKPELVLLLKELHAEGKVEIIGCGYVPIPTSLAFGKVKERQRDVFEKVANDVLDFQHKITFSSNAKINQPAQNRLQTGAMGEWHKLFDKDVELAKSNEFLALADASFFESMKTKNRGKDAAPFDSFINYMNILQGLGGGTADKWQV